MTRNSLRYWYFVKVRLERLRRVGETAAAACVLWHHIDLRNCSEVRASRTMAQGKLKVKTRLPSASKGKVNKGKKGPAIQRRANAPITPKKNKLAEARKLKQIVTKTVNKAMEDELREKALEGKKSLTKKDSGTTISSKKK